MHIPVLQKEVLQYLDPKPNENFIDATIGGGGHTIAILERNKPKGKILGIELDPELHQNLKSRMAEFPISNFQFSNRLILTNDSYANLKKIVEKYKFKPVHGILFDLGMSSFHLSESGRGFTLQKKEPLDMRYNPQGILTAEKIINFWSKFEIEKILREYGEERFSRKIAEKIIEERRVRTIKTTFQLIEAIKKGVPRGYQRQRIHFATRTFQALRIAVNDELNNLKKALSQTPEILEPGGRVAVISFHSLEDRIVKNFFKNQAWEGQPTEFLVREGSPKIKILTKKAVRPSEEEVRANPRARSAKLRVAYI